MQSPAERGLGGVTQSSQWKMLCTCKLEVHEADMLARLTGVHFRAGRPIAGDGAGLQGSRQGLREHMLAGVPSFQLR